MALLLKNGAIFLHIPKTGGSWVSSVLEDQGLVDRKICHIHADLDEVYRFLNFRRVIGSEIMKQLNPYASVKSKIFVKRGFRTVILSKRKKIPFIFCFVRNPLGWYESYFTYMQANGWPELGDIFDVASKHPCSVLNGIDHETFEDFISAVVDKFPGFLTNLFSRYTDARIGYIGKQESLVDDLVAVLEYLKLDFNEDSIRSFQKVNMREKDSLVDIVWTERIEQDIFACEYPIYKRFEY